MIDKEERTIRIATIVDTMEEAFAFVITHIDKEKFTHPSVNISAITVFRSDMSDIDDPQKRFEVVVFSMIENKE